MPTNNLLSASQQSSPSHRVAPIPSGAKYSAAAELDTQEFRKARGAFFTPPAIVRFMTDWAIRHAADTVLEPSCGDAEFLVHAVERLRHLGAEHPAVNGVEIHASSAAIARTRVSEAGGRPDIRVSDFFAAQPSNQYTAVVGNPPYIRARDWTGEARARSRTAAAAAGVELSGLASSWAAFTAHSTSFLAPGGRMAFVLPTELLSVGYAAPIRRLLLERFSAVELVTFDEQVFPDAEVDVVLVLADGYGERASGTIATRHAHNADALTTSLPAEHWTPSNPSAKWTPALMDAAALAIYSDVTAGSSFVGLGSWGSPKLGIVSGNNGYFGMSPARSVELGLGAQDVVPLSPPGSSHLRGLEFTAPDLERLGQQGSSTLLFAPVGEPSAAASSYIAGGEAELVHTAYKCRMRRDWWRVPTQAPPDLFLTYMNDDTARLTTNAADAHHLNSVHGVYLRSEVKQLGRELLPLASLNSVTLLGAEVVGRSLGGGMLKVEPGEARLLPVPGPDLVSRAAAELRAVRPEVASFLRDGRLLDAVAIVDRIILSDQLSMADPNLASLRRGQAAAAGRRRAK